MIQATLLAAASRFLGITILPQWEDAGVRSAPPNKAIYRGILGAAFEPIAATVADDLMNWIAYTKNNIFNNIQMTAGYCSSLSFKDPIFLGQLLAVQADARPWRKITPVIRQATTVSDRRLEIGGYVPSSLHEWIFGTKGITHVKNNKIVHFYCHTLIPHLSLRSIS